MPASRVAWKCRLRESRQKNIWSGLNRGLNGRATRAKSPSEHSRRLPGPKPKPKQIVGQDSAIANGLGADGLTDSHPKPVAMCDGPQPELRNEAMKKGVLKNVTSLGVTPILMTVGLWTAIVLADNPISIAAAGAGLFFSIIAMDDPVTPIAFGVGFFVSIIVWMV